MDLIFGQEQQGSGFPLIKKNTSELVFFPYMAEFYMPPV